MRPNYLKIVLVVFPLSVLLAAAGHLNDPPWWLIVPVNSLVMSRVALSDELLNLEES